MPTTLSTSTKHELLDRVVDDSAVRVELFVPSRVNIDVSMILIDISRVNIQMKNTSADVYHYV